MPLKRNLKCAIYFFLGTFSFMVQANLWLGPDLYRSQKKLKLLSTGAKKKVRQKSPENFDSSKEASQFIPDNSNNMNSQNNAAGDTDAKLESAASVNGFEAENAQEKPKMQDGSNESTDQPIEPAKANSSENSNNSSEPEIP